MPRQGRIDAPGVIHHVIQRGITKGRIFNGKADYEIFAERLGKLVEESKTSCLAWVLMPNHLHLLLRSGRDPIGRVMQRLLTWYAGYYNRRNSRSGHLFQNRFKSILCEEEPYFLELVRYIHLNPVRSGLVGTMKDLERYEWSGHGALTGSRGYNWQDTETVLEAFGKRVGKARRAYIEFLEAGFSLGHRKEFEGGGIFRSAAGEVEYINADGRRATTAGDERILGSGDFVEEVLREAEKREVARSRLKRSGWDLEAVVKRAGKEAGLEPAQVRGGGKSPRQCRARALVCYWSVSELGYTGAEVASRLDITGAAVSVNVRRGQEIARMEKLSLGRR